MTKLDRALHRLALLPPERQAEIVEILHVLVEADVAGGVPTWQIEELKRRLFDPGDFADDDEVEAFFAQQRK